MFDLGVKGVAPVESVASFMMVCVDLLLDAIIVAGRATLRVIVVSRLQYPATRFAITVTKLAM